MAFDKTYTQSPFRGQIHSPAPVTPFNGKGELMLDDFAAILRYHRDVVRVDTMLIAGCNGEGYALADEELGLVTEVAAEVVGGRIPFYVHVSRTPTRECIARAEIAAKAGAYGIALGQPQIYDSTASKVVERFADVSRAVPLPMMVYNLSHLSHFGLAPEIMREICDAAPVEVVKDVPTEFDHIKRMIVEVGDRVPVLYGHKDTLIPALLLGGGGFVGTGPEVFGAQCRGLFFEVHDMSPPERMDLHCRYGMVSDALMWSIGKPPAGIKAAMTMLGLPGGIPREHIQPLTGEEERRLRDVLVGAGILEGPVAKRA